VENPASIRPDPPESRRAVFQRAELSVGGLLLLSFVVSQCFLLYFASSFSRAMRRDAAAQERLATAHEGVEQAEYANWTSTAIVHGSQTRTGFSRKPPDESEEEFWTRHVRFCEGLLR
jgi:hypothetical protein